eukprot:COSAG06_NODE_7038_length_2664_cov_1.561793_2_plen_194_part_00
MPWAAHREHMPDLFLNGLKEQQVHDLLKHLYRARGRRAGIRFLTRVRPQVPLEAARLGGSVGAARPRAGIRFLTGVRPRPTLRGGPLLGPPTRAIRRDSTSDVHRPWLAGWHRWLARWVPLDQREQVHGQTEGVTARVTASERAPQPASQRQRECHSPCHSLVCCGVPCGVLTQIAPASGTTLPLLQARRLIY